MYKIILKDLKVNLPIGIFDFEKEKTQPVVMQLVVHSYSNYKFNSINDCVDYSKIAEFIKGFENKPHVELIEQLQLQIMDFCFSLDEDIYFVDLTIYKTDIIPDVECGINMTFQRQEYLEMKRQVS